MFNMFGYPYFKTSWWVDNFYGVNDLFQKHIMPNYTESNDIKSYRTFNLMQMIWKYLFRKTNLLSDTTLDELYFYQSGEIIMIHNEYMCAAAHYNHPGIIVFSVSNRGIGKKHCGEGFINEINPIVKTFDIKHEAKEDCLILSEVPWKCYYPIIHSMLTDDLIDKPRYIPKPKPKKKPLHLPTYQNPKFSKLIRWIYYEFTKPMAEMLKNNFQLRRDSGEFDILKQKQELSTKLRNSIEIYDNFVKYCDNVLDWNKVADMYWNKIKSDGTLSTRFSIKLDVSRFGSLDIMLLEYDFALMREKDRNMFDRIMGDRVLMGSAKGICDMTISSKQAMSGIKQHKQMVRYTPNYTLSRRERDTSILSTSIMIPEDPDKAYELKRILEYNDFNTYDGADIYY